MRVIDIDDEGKDESAALVHSCEYHASVCQPDEGASIAIFERVSRTWRAPPIIPSSGVMVSVKLRRSEGSGKLVFMVDGRSSSVKSGMLYAPEFLSSRGRKRLRLTFLDTNLGCASLWLLLSGRLLGLLHAPYLRRYQLCSSLQVEKTHLDHRV